MGTATPSGNQTGCCQLAYFCTKCLSNFVVSVKPQERCCFRGIAQLLAAALLLSS
jgi:hypothetical protein